MNAPAGLRKTLLSLAVALGAGCTVGGPSRMVRDLESEDPARRASAIIALVDAGDTAYAPLLVDRLSDEDGCVRVLAAEGLTRLTGRSFGSASPADAEAEWRRYFVEEARRKRAQP